MVIKPRAEGARNQSESSIVAVTAWVTIRLNPSAVVVLVSPNTIENPSKNAIRFQRLKTLLWSVESSREAVDLGAKVFQ